MENTEIKEPKKNLQVSFRAPEIKEKLEEIALERGITVSELAKSLCVKGLAVESNQKRGDKIKVETKEKAAKGKETTMDLTDLINKTIEKQDSIIELLLSLIQTSTKSEETDSDLYTQEEFDLSLGRLLSEQEEELMKNNLLIRLTEEQKNLLYKVLSYRKEKGKIFSESVEDLFFFMFKETFFEGWNHKQDDFDDEFKAAFPDKFES